MVSSVLLKVVRFCRRRPWVVIAAAVALTGAALAYTRGNLEFRTSRTALIEAEAEWNQRFLAFREEFGGRDDILVVLQGAPLEERQRFATELAERLEGSQWIDRIFYRVDPEPFRARALLYLDPAELEELRGELEDNRDALARLAESPGLVPVLSWVDREVSESLVGGLVRGLLGGGDDEKEEPAPGAADEQPPQEEEPEDLSFLLSLLAGIEAQLTPAAGPTAFRSPWETYLGVEGNGHDGFLVSENERYLFLLVRPREDPGNFDKEGPALRTVREAIAALRPAFPAVETGLTGQPVLASEEVRTSTKDASLAGTLALVGVTLIFWFGFHVRRHALMTVAALMISLGWAAGALTLLVGHLTILSVAFVSILTGIGVEFGIHLVARYEEEREKGRSRDEALDISVSQTGSGIFYGALTGSLAFFALALTDFLGIAELGIIAGSGLLLCMVAMLTVLPALIALFPAAPPGAGRQRRNESVGASKLVRWGPPHGRVLVVALMITAGCAALAPRVGFDGNLLNLQARGLEAVELELDLLEDSGRSSVFAVTMADTLEEARQKAQQFEALPEVARVESLAEVVPPNQQERLPEVLSLAPLVEDLSTTPVAPAELDLQRLDEVIDRLRFKVRPSDRWREGEQPPREQLEAAQTRLRAIHARLQQLQQLPPEAPERRAVEAQLAAYQTRLVDDLYQKLSLLAQSPQTTPLTLEDVPASMRDILQGKTGKFLLRIYPEQNVWEPELAEQFVTALRSVDPEVTGAPVQAWESTRLMRAGYIQGGLYALAVVLFLLLLDFRSIPAALLALVPLTVGALWTLGFMALADVEFNLANLVIVPLIIGLSIDIGIHLVHRARADGLVGWPLVASSTGRAVAVGALTSAVGFGSLLVSRHQGMQSIGLLLTVGMTLPLLAAFTVLCPLLAVLARRRGTAPAAESSSGSRDGVTR